MPSRSTRPARALSVALAIALALGAALAAPGALAAQSADSSAAARADTAVRAHLLEAVVVIAEQRDGFLSRVWRGIGARAELSALQRQNRALAYQVRAYDRRIERLEKRVAELRAPRDAMLRQIAATDSATTAVRSQRARLEARVRALEGPTGGTE